MTLMTKILISLFKKTTTWHNHTLQRRVLDTLEYLDILRHKGRVLLAKNKVSSM
jgi:hypothetical protein